MKKTIKRIALFAAICLILTFFAGCSSSGKKAMTLDGTSFSYHLVQFYMSRLKAVLATSYGVGDQINSDSFWETVFDESGKTYDEYFREVVVAQVKLKLAASVLFDELKLTLSENTVKSIDDEIEELIENDAEGKKSLMNKNLAPYGANVDILRQAYLLDAKSQAVCEALYGERGQKLDGSILENYYEKTYARFKQIFLYTYTNVYETDGDGEDVWYTTDGKISYDTTAVIRTDALGNIVKDVNGDTVYETPDGKVAYLEEGAKRSVLRDDDGRIITRPYTETELIEVSDYAQRILDKVEENNYTLFDTCVENYSEEEGKDLYPGGYYFTADSDYDAPEVVDALFEMKPGEIRKVYSDLGIHIMMRYELPEGGYAAAENEDFFISTANGGYVFLDELVNELMTEKLKPYCDRVTIDEKVINSLSFADLEPNYYY